MFALKKTLQYLDNYYTECPNNTYGYNKECLLSCPNSNDFPETYITGYIKINAQKNVLLVIMVKIFVNLVDQSVKNALQMDITEMVETLNAQKIVQIIIFG